jgi:hypothetical protein
MEWKHFDAGVVKVSQWYQLWLVPTRHIFWAPYWPLLRILLGYWPITGPSLPSFNVIRACTRSIMGIVKCGSQQQGQPGKAASDGV